MINFIEGLKQIISSIDDISEIEIDKAADSDDVWHETGSALLAICEGNPRAIGRFPLKTPINTSFILPLLLSRSNYWRNCRVAGDLRRHNVHVTPLWCFNAFKRFRPVHKKSNTTIELIPMSLFDVNTKSRPPPPV